MNRGWKTSLLLKTHSQGQSLRLVTLGTVSLQTVPEQCLAILGEPRRADDQSLVLYAKKRYYWTAYTLCLARPCMVLPFW